MYDYLDEFISISSSSEVTFPAQKHHGMFVPGVVSLRQLKLVFDVCRSYQLWTKMKPPTKSAITQALNILLESIQEENECNFASSRNRPLDTISLEQRAKDLEILGLAKLHLDKEADELISRIHHHRNLAAPIHRLPQEIFGMILEDFAAHRPLDEEYGLLQLLRVGRLWYHAIVNAPRLWTRLDSSLPPKIARLVIDRSKDLPILSLTWTTVYGYEDYQAHEEILEMAIQNSTRFQSMELRVSSDDPFPTGSLLEAPTPALEALTVEVDNSQAGEGGFEGFVLSEGAPLKQLALSDVTFSFDSSRLSGLVTLSLHQFAIPSLPTLLQVLSVTQRLEELTLGENSWIDESVAPGPQITLGHLKELRIEAIASEYCAALLISIYNPVCSRVHVSDAGWNAGTDPLDPLIWQPGNKRTAALLGLHRQPDTQVFGMSIDIATYTVNIRTHKKEDGQRVLWFHRPQSWRMVTLLGHFLRDVEFCPPIDLAISSSIPQSDPFDLIPWGPLLNQLTLSDPTASLRALEQLAQRPAATNANERGTSKIQVEDWMCPNLQRITLHSPNTQSEGELYVAALLSLVSKRWSGTDGGPTNLLSL